MADFFASEYGWTDDYIMSEVALDRYFIRKEIIEKRNLIEYRKQIDLQMIPHIEDKERNKLLKDIERQLNPVKNNNYTTETDVEGLKALKAMQN